jgi:hypothetical protein
MTSEERFEELWDLVKEEFERIENLELTEDDLETLLFELEKWK